MHDDLYVKNYFKDCPCCGNKKFLLKSEAKSFETIKWVDSLRRKFLIIQYATKEAYEQHLKAIKQWEKEAKEWKKLRDI